MEIITTTLVGRWTLLSTVTLIVLLRYGVNSHGRLMNPPARNCMWRMGYPNPVNYNDNEQFCGGFEVQYGDKNRGKCGICGDEAGHPVPKPHEQGGLFANGIITRTYYSGQMITLVVDLTSNHHGFFTFRICSADNFIEEVTQECLDDNILPIVSEDGNKTYKYKIGTTAKSASFQFQVQLPLHLTCERCVLQWTYTAGNNWGTCDDGSTGLGCGDVQETFKNCADVEIISNSQRRFWLDPSLTSSTRSNPHMVYFKDFGQQGAPLTPLIIRTQVCVARDKWIVLPGMDDWCQRNCHMYPPYCPKNMCRCVEDCEAVGDFKLTTHMADQWCLDQCSVFPIKNCTAQRCLCS